MIAQAGSVFFWHHSQVWRRSYYQQRWALQRQGYCTCLVKVSGPRIFPGPATA
jgi:hypothetical protein